jgi:glucose-6-phosphate 1-dehydrogenase
MDFAHSKLFGPVTPESYEVIIEDVLRDEQSVSVRFDEIESAWHAIERIRELHAPLYTYAKGSTGPEEIKLFECKHGMRWKA